MTHYQVPREETSITLILLEHVFSKYPTPSLNLCILGLKLMCQGVFKSKSYNNKDPLKSEKLFLKEHFHLICRTKDLILNSVKQLIFRSKDCCAHDIQYCRYSLTHFPVHGILSLSQCTGP